MSASIKLRLDEFCMRQFDDPSYVGTQISADKTEFMKQVNDYLKTHNPPLKEGYAPFCKHIFLPNFVKGLKVGTLPITPQNAHLVMSGYKARTELELAVLQRWFPREKVQIPDATWLDLILYSREQIAKECQDMGNPVPTEDYDWGLISVKGQLEDFELPMTPITVMRNALGRDQGGSGVALDRAKYNESVKYWQDHASLL